MEDSFLNLIHSWEVYISFTVALPLWIISHKFALKMAFMPIVPRRFSEKIGREFTSLPEKKRSFVEKVVVIHRGE